jgi:carbamoyl-phosphate synthase small subunit
MPHAYALLVLQDGTVFLGKSIGADGHTSGEVVFNTSMTGYQEILTDPSYTNQMVTLTYPHIGNVGTNQLDEESDRVYAAGLIIRDISLLASNYRNQQSLPDYLKNHNIVAISDIDTRKLTRLLREKGAQQAYIITGDQIDDLKNKISDIQQKAANLIDLKGMDLAKVVSCQHSYTWQLGSASLNRPSSSSNTETPLPYHVVAYDFGIKRNILRMLVDRGCNVTVVPAQTPAQQVMALKPDGIFLSNGPGDPAACTYAINAIKQCLASNVPLFGICLGHQLLALACGARTIKMKFGHHGANHPVKDLINDRVMITAQNHGFTVDATTLPPDLQVTHVSLFDGSVQGIHHMSKPAFSFQGHPEASPGPHDAASLFDHFIQLMITYKQSKTA